jgi:membrane protein
MAEDTPEPSPDERPRGASVRSRVATARTKAEELQRRSLERLALESERRSWVRTLVNAYEADRNRGGGLLAGGLAYRVFLWERPAALVLVSVLAVASSTSGRAPEDIARSAGLSGALVATVATAVHETDRVAWWLLILGTMLMLWAGRSAVRALQIVCEIAWSERDRVHRATVVSSLVFSGVTVAIIALQAALTALMHGVLGYVIGWVVGTLLTLGVSVWVMAVLPHAGRRWFVVLPGALFFAAIVRLATMATVVYFVPKLGRIDDLYGGLAIAIVILLFLYVIARAFVGGEFINATFAGVSRASLRDQRDASAGRGADQGEDA